MSIRVGVDASAGLAIASRRGLGRTKHIQVQYLWVQDVVSRRDVSLVKIGTEVNRSDLLTKGLAAPRMEDLLSKMGYEFVSGKSKVALSAYG